MGFGRISISHSQPGFQAGLSGNTKPIEPIIRSSEKSNSPYRLKCTQAATEQCNEIGKSHHAGVSIGEKRNA